MRIEPIEHCLTSRYAKRARREARRSRSDETARDAQSATTPAIIDEAFAALARHTGRIGRVDGAMQVDPARRTRQSANGEMSSAPSRSLCRQLAAQLESLDRHRSELALLLRSMDAETSD